MANRSASDERDGAPSRDAIEALLDLFVYAPIGLVLDAQQVAPDLAERGRRHTAAARQIGEMAVRAGMRKLDQAVKPPTTDAAPSSEEPVGAAEPEPELDPTAPSDDAHLAIEGYDLLAASQIVKRLDALTAEELEAVRAYEADRRARRTILSKLARLQG